MKDKHTEETQKRGAPWKDDGRARLTVDGVSNVSDAIFMYS